MNSLISFICGESNIVGFVFDISLPIKISYNSSFSDRLSQKQNLAMIDQLGKQKINKIKINKSQIRKKLCAFHFIYSTYMND